MSSIRTHNNRRRERERRLREPGVLWCHIKFSGDPDCYEDQIIRWGETDIDPVEAVQREITRMKRAIFFDVLTKGMHIAEFPEP